MRFLKFQDSAEREAWVRFVESQIRTHWFNNFDTEEIAHIADLLLQELRSREKEASR